MEQLKCPACGGHIMMDQEKAILFCPYCGAKMPQKQDALDKIIRHKEQTQRFAEEIRQQKVREKLAAEDRQSKKSTKAIIGSLIALVAIGLVIFFGIQGENRSEQELKALVTEIQADLEAGNYDIALFKTEQLHWPHGDTVGLERWDSQREALKKVIRDAKEGAGK